MSVKSGVLELKTKLLKVENDDEATIAILKELSSLKVDKDILMSTAIGKTVNKHRNASSTAVRDMARAIVATWKKIVLGGVKSAANSKKVAAKATKAKAEAPPAKTPAEAVPTTEAASAAGVEAASSSAGKVYVLGSAGEDMRNKVQKTVFKALQGEEAQRTKVAVLIEEALHSKHLNTGSEYRMHIRELLFNLKDPNNPDLVRNVSLELVPAADLVNKDVAELASDAMKAQREKDLADNIERARCDWAEHADTGWSDMFQCPECLGWKTKFNQKQIRGADEPMTTFLFCGDCKHRWTDGDH